VGGSARFESKGLSASRVRQAHQLIGAVLNFAVKAKRLSANPADGVELPRLPEVQQRYLTHEQLHRLAVASENFAPLSWCWATAVFGSVRPLPYGWQT
jgi:site-specific recombinase XerC